MRKRRDTLKAMNSKRRRNLRVRLRKLYGDECPICGVTMLFECEGNRGHAPQNYATVDHIVRATDGGSDRIENLRLLCKGCNNGRHAAKFWQHLADRSKVETQKQRRLPDDQTGVP